MKKMLFFATIVASFLIVPRMVVAQDLESLNSKKKELEAQLNEVKAQIREQSSQYFHNFGFGVNGDVRRGGGVNVFAQWTNPNMTNSFVVDLSYDYSTDVRTFHSVSLELFFYPYKWIGLGTQGIISFNGKSEIGQDYLWEDFLGYIGTNKITWNPVVLEFQIPINKIGYLHRWSINAGGTAGINYFREGGKYSKARQNFNLFLKVRYSPFKGKKKK